MRQGVDPDWEALVLEDVDVTLGPVQILYGCSAAISDGITFLIGPNGAGKSTLLGAIAGNVPVRSGKMYLGGRYLEGPPFHRARAGLGRTFQVPQEFGTLTVLENVMAALGGAGDQRFLRVLVGRRSWQRDEVAAAEEAWRLLERCDLARVGGSQAMTLSGGQRKLLELARCLARKPRVALLDEPFAGVSPFLVEQMMGAIMEARGAGTKFVIVAHEMGRVRELSESVLVMSAGRIVAHDEYEAIAASDAIAKAFMQ